MATTKKLKKKKKVVRVKDLRIPKRYSLEEVGASQSLISDFACPRKFLYKINRYVHESDNILSSFGNIVHELCAGLYIFDTKSFAEEENIKGLIERIITVSKLTLRKIIEYLIY